MIVAHVPEGLGRAAINRVIPCYPLPANAGVEDSGASTGYLFEHTGVEVDDAAGDERAAIIYDASRRFPVADVSDCYYRALRQGLMGATASLVEVVRGFPTLTVCSCRCRTRRRNRRRRC